MKKTNSTLSFVKRILIYSVDGAPKNPHSLLIREREGDVCETRAVKWGVAGGRGEGTGEAGKRRTCTRGKGGKGRRKSIF